MQRSIRCSSLCLEKLEPKPQGRPMLILSRKANESIVIDGRITVKVVRVDGDVVKLGIQAPPSVAVHRQEVYEEIQKNNQEALTHGRPALPKLKTAKTKGAISNETPAELPPHKDAQS